MTAVNRVRPASPAPLVNDLKPRLPHQALHALPVHAMPHTPQIPRNLAHPCRGGLTKLPIHKAHELLVLGDSSLTS